MCQSINLGEAIITLDIFHYKKCHTLSYSIES